MNFFMEKNLDLLNNKKIYNNIYCSGLIGMQTENLKKN